MANTSRFHNYSSDDYEKRKIQLEKDTIARFTRGNICAGNGHYMTRAELEEKRDEIEHDVNQK
ncbi:hypothetical protein [Mesorhizobium sp. M0678]|uniref:hypothetical protein n=1 Tax=unclassified Mesorhizobium TaxID=325217 RepID=UPI00333DE1C1